MLCNDTVKTEKISTECFCYLRSVVQHKIWHANWQVLLPSSLKLIYSYVFWTPSNRQINNTRTNLTNGQIKMKWTSMSQKRMINEICKIERRRYNIGDIDLRRSFRSSYRIMFFHKHLFSRLGACMTQMD